MRASSSPNLEVLRTKSFTERVHSQFESEMSQLEIQSQKDCSCGKNPRPRDFDHFESLPGLQRGSEKMDFKKKGAYGRDVRMPVFQSQKRISEKVSEKDFLFEWNASGGRGLDEVFSFHRPDEVTKVKPNAEGFLCENEQTNVFREARESPGSKVDSKPPDFSDLKDLFDSPDVNTRKLVFSSLQKSSMKVSQFSKFRPNLMRNLADDDFIKDFDRALPLEDSSARDSPSASLLQESLIEWNQDLTKIMQKYLLSENVVSNPKYVQIWIDFSKVVDEPEEVFVYMHSKGIGDFCPVFYARWMALYAQEKQFIYAYNVLDLFQESYKRMVRRPDWWGSFFASEAELKQHFAEIKKVLKGELELEIMFAMKNDFHNKNFFVDERNPRAKSFRKTEMVRRKYNITSGMEYEDFMSIKNKNLKSHCSQVLEIVYGYDELYCKRLTDSLRTSESLFKSGSNSMNNSKQNKEEADLDGDLIAEEILSKLRNKREAFEIGRLSYSFKKKMDLSQNKQKRMNLSDLLFRKTFKNSSMEIYIDKEYRKEFQMENEAALEYEYYRKKYSHLLKASSDEKIPKNWIGMTSNFFGELNFNELLLMESFKEFSFNDSIFFQNRKPEIFFVKESNRNRIKEMVQSKVLAIAQRKNKKSKKKRKKRKLVPKKTRSNYKDYLNTQEYNENFLINPVVSNSKIKLDKLVYKKKKSIRVSSKVKELPRFQKFSD